MKLCTLLLSAALCLPALSSAFEIKEIELLNGTIYKNCSVSEETDEYYIVSILPEEGKSIRVERKVPKKDVKRLVKPTQEEIDFKRLTRLFPQEEAVDEVVAADVEVALARFQKKYPTSPNLAQIEEVRTMMKGVLAHLEAGDVRVDGKWMPKAAQDRILYSMHSKKILASMRARLDSRDYRNVLNLQDKMAKDFSMSESAVTATKIARVAGLAYEKQLSELSQKTRKEYDERQVRLRKLPTAEAAKIREAERKVADEFRGKLTADRNAGIRYCTYNPKDYMSIDQAKNQVENFNSIAKRDGDRQESPHLGKADSYFQLFWTKLDERDLKAAKEQVNNINGCRVPESYKEAMRAAYTKLQEELEQERVAEQEAAAQLRKEAAEKKAAEDKARRDKAEAMKAENERKSREAAAEREAARAKGKK